jgi:hypothetical protein
MQVPHAAESPLGSITHDCNSTPFFSSRGLERWYASRQVVFADYRDVYCLTCTLLECAVSDIYTFRVHAFLGAGLLYV